MKRNLTPAENFIIERMYAHKWNDGYDNPLIFWRSSKLQIAPSHFEHLSSLGGVGYLAPFLLHPDAAVAHKALAQLALLLSKATHADFIWLDENVRSVYYGCRGRGWANRWLEADENTVRTLPFKGRDLVISLTILACHNNGYVRYEALRRLTHLSAKDAVKIGFVRANDWVDKVSELGNQVIRQHLPALSEEELAQHLLLLNQLQQKKRRDLSSITQKVRAKLLSTTGIDALLRTVRASDYKTSRLAFELLRLSSIDTSTLLNIAIGHKDTVLRAKAFTLIDVLPDPQTKIYWLCKLAADTYAPICKKALYRLAETHPNASSVALKNNLLHKNRGVRDVSRFYLKRLEPVDFIKTYLAALDNSKDAVLKTAILGLSEVGDKSMWEGIARFSDASSDQVKAAVVTACGNLRCNTAEWFLAKIMRGCIAEAKAASDILVMDRDFMPFDVINLLHQQQDFQRIKLLIRTIRPKNKWLHLLAVLTVYISVTGRHKTDFEREIAIWLSRHCQPYWFVKPDHQLLDSVQTLLPIAKPQQNSVVIARLMNYVDEIDRSVV